MSSALRVVDVALSTSHDLRDVRDLSPASLRSTMPAPNRSPVKIAPARRPRPTLLPASGVAPFTDMPSTKRSATSHPRCPSPAAHVEATHLLATMRANVALLESVLHAAPSRYVHAALNELRQSIDRLERSYGLARVA